jgi:NitT/TauT family transport system ATP-binding protein
LLAAGHFQYDAQLRASLVKRRLPLNALSKDFVSPRVNAVEIDCIQKTYVSRKGPVLALRDISLSIHERQFVSLLGPSGCGKSTLLRCIAGLETPSGGVVRVDGNAVQRPPESMGIVFQRDVLLDWLDVLDNILLPAKLKRFDKVEAIRRANELLRLIGLEGFEHRSPWELSGGMRQRIAICRALLLNPSLLLMDEPFGALDAMTRDELNVELQRLWMTNTNTVIFVTHSIPEAAFLSDRVIVMSRSPGSIVDIVDIELARPRALAVRETPEFGAYVSRIRRIFEGFGMLRGRHVRD